MLGAIRLEPALGDTAVGIDARLTPTRQTAESQRLRVGFLDLRHRA